MRRLRALEASAIALACCAVTACGSSDGAAPTPSVSPSVAPSSVAATGGASSGNLTTTPAASGSASSSVSDPAQDTLYLEAVEVYKKYFAEMQKFEAAQYPTRTLPKSMDAYMTPAVRADITAAVNASQDAGEVPQRGQSSRLAAIQPNPGAHWGGSVTSVSVCVDSQAVEIVRPHTGQHIRPGVLAYKQIFFSRRAKTLVMSYIDAKVVTRCPDIGP